MKTVITLSVVIRFASLLSQYVLIIITYLLLRHVAIYTRSQHIHNLGPLNEGHILQ